MQRKPVSNQGAGPRKTLASNLQRTNSTPVKKTDSRSSTPVPTTTSPSRSLTGIARDSTLTKQADAALNSLETTLQEHTDQLTTKIEQMSARISALDDMMQDLLKDDFDDPDRSITPRPSGERRRFSGEPLVSMPETAPAMGIALTPEEEVPIPSVAPASARLAQGAGPRTPMFPLVDTGTPLLSEQSPFFTDKWPRRRME